VILVTGGSGFVGRHLIERLRREGIPVRALVRDSAKARMLEDLGAETAPGDVTDPVSLGKAASGVERVVHLVGIIQESAGATFKSVHVDGTRNVLEAAEAGGARHVFFQSALGTRPNARSAYHRTKWEAEEQVRAGRIPYTIFRPSLIYGAGDQFTLRLAEMIRLSPVLPVIGRGTSKVQPIFIDDVVTCIVKAVTGEAYLNEQYELGGPEQLTYEAVTEAIAEAMGIKRPTAHLPFFLMKAAARVFEAAVPRPPLTRDQLIMLQEDNVCGMRDIRDAFGVEPVKFSDGLKTFIRERTRM
jgi:uncharacterized protein YbjT (DUF2867 family)